MSYQPAVPMYSRPTMMSHTVAPMFVSPPVAVGPFPNAAIVAPAAAPVIVPTAAPPASFLPWRPELVATKEALYEGILSTPETDPAEIDVPFWPYSDRRVKQVKRGATTGFRRPRTNKPAHYTDEQWEVLQQYGRV